METLHIGVPGPGRYTLILDENRISISGRDTKQLRNQLVIWRMQGASIRGRVATFESNAIALVIWRSLILTATDHAINVRGDVSHVRAMDQKP